MYVHASAKTTHIIHDPAQGGTEVGLEVTAVGDAGEPNVYGFPSIVFNGTMTQQMLDDRINLKVSEFLASAGVTLEPGRVFVVGPRVV